MNNTEKTIANIDVPICQIDYTQSQRGILNIPINSSYVKQLLIQADGGGDDLPCIGYHENQEGRAFVRVLFKTLKVKVRDAGN